MRAVRPYGPSAFLLECSGPEEAVALHLSLRADPVPGVLQTVPGAVSLLVECASSAAARSAARDLAVVPVPEVRRQGREHVIGVVYDGADLGDLGLPADEVVALHTASVCTVALTGFAPGFAYLSGLHPRLSLPRRPSPRPVVPAGSVAIGGSWTGIYPRSGPGGWNLIGTTSVPLWDLTADPPALLGIGDTVRFEAV